MAHECISERAEERHAPVMLIVANRTETATRIRRPFDRRLVHVNEHWGEERSVHIDSKVFAVADAATQPAAGTATGGAGNNPLNKTDRKPTKKEQVERLRQQADTVGHAGHRIQDVISAGC